MKRLIYLLAAVAFTACGSATSLSVMTFNMRYDNPEDGQNNWRFRRERIAGVIKAQEVDVLGTQELLSNQFNDLSGLLTGYQGVGVGRLDGAESGEYCAVFFRKDRFTLLDSGTFWLSETPEVVGSLGWDGACERIATWVVLRDRDGRELFFIDTHLDHVGQVARDEGVSLLMKRIETLSGGRPVILTGDFNSEPGSSVVAHVQKDGVDLISELEKQYDFVRSVDEITARKGKVICIDETMDDAAEQANLTLLADATRASIAKLQERGGKGFFLMVEGAKIDYAGHSRCLPGSIIEMLSFDLAVAEALKFADRNGETLVVVTADHETGGLVLVDGDERTGRVMGVYVSDDHTPAMLPVFAYGPGADKFCGTYMNTEIARRIKSLIK